MTTHIGVSKIVVSDNVRSIPGAENISDLGAAKLEEFPEWFQDEIRQLAKSIDEYGLIHPLTVKDLGNGERYRLIAGFRRLKALQYLKRRSIDVKSIKGKSEDELVIQLIENIQRQDLNAIDVAKSLRQISRLKGLTKQSEIAKFLGKSVSWVSQHLVLLRSDESLKKAIGDGEIAFGAASVIAALPKEEQEPALRSAYSEAKINGKEKISVKGARRHARRRKVLMDRQMRIRPVEEREREQRESLITAFLGEAYGDLAVSDEVRHVVEDFWAFLFRKNRIVVKQ